MDAVSSSRKVRDLRLLFATNNLPCLARCTSKEELTPYLTSCGSCAIRGG